MTLFTITQMINKHIFHPLQNISKSESKKLDVFGSKFRQNIFTFVDQLVLIICNREGISITANSSIITNCKIKCNIVDI
jgi:hypothetical protein